MERQLFSQIIQCQVLSFQSCLFGDKTLYSFLRDFPRLRTLQLGAKALPHSTELRSSSPARGLTDSFWLGAALQAHNKDTLEILKLWSATPLTGTNFIGDISGLSKLRVLDIGVGGLFKLDDIDEALLPKSLEKLCIFCGNNVDQFKMAKDYCKDLLKYGDEDFPSLTHIILQCHIEMSELRHLIRQGKVTSFSYLERDCISNGVNLSIRCDDGEFDNGESDDGSDGET